VSKINVALIGSGNIGTDLMYKALRSANLAPAWMVGIDPASDGLARARDAGLKTTAEGLDGLLPHVARAEFVLRSMPHRPMYIMSTRVACASTGLRSST